MGRAHHRKAARRRIDHDVARRCRRGNESRLQSLRLDMRMISRGLGKLFNQTSGMSWAVHTPLSQRRYFWMTIRYFAPPSRPVSHANPALVPGDEVNHLHVETGEPGSYSFNKMKLIDPEPWDALLVPRPALFQR